VRKYADRQWLNVQKVKSILKAIEIVLFIYCWMIFVFALLIVLFNGVDMGYFSGIQGFAGNDIKAAIAFVIIMCIQVVDFKDLIDKHYKKRLEKYKNLTNDN